MEEEHNIQDARHRATRMELIWEASVFQLKLAVDGIRDIILVPISIVATLLGLIAGGDDPRQYFRKVLRFGRQTENWINLFGGREASGTSDEILEPFKSRVLDHTTDRNKPQD